MNIWLEKLLVVLLLDYIFLFGLESVLPGFVMDVFNLNYLLLVIVAILLYIAFFTYAMPAKQEAQEKKITLMEKVVVGFVVVFLVVVTAFSLYKAPVYQVALYISLAIISSVALYKALEKE